MACPVSKDKEKWLLQSFVPKTRLKNSWLSQSIIRFSLYSHELLETLSVWALLWLPFQENGFVLSKSLLNQILQKVYKTNETSNLPLTHVIKLVSISFCEFICSENSMKKQLVVPKCHTFFIVFTRIARNIFNLMLLWLPFQEKGFVLNKILPNRILQKVYKTNETSNPPPTHVIKLVSTSIDSTATKECWSNLRKKSSYNLL